MKRLILLCSNVAGEAISDYLPTHFSKMPVMQGCRALAGKTARMISASLWFEGEAIPERSWI